MEYKLEDGSVIYERETPDTYVISNVILTLELRRGLPYKLFSSREGLLLKFVKIYLDKPTKSIFWPDGCKFESEKVTWSFYTSPFINSILWQLENVEMICLEFSAPLEKLFKVPFGDNLIISRPLKVTSRQSTIEVSGIVLLDVMEGKIDEFFENSRGYRLFFLKLRSNRDRRLKIRFSVPNRWGEIVDEQKENSTYIESLKRHVPSRLGELEKSLLFFSIHTALSNWKDFGSVKAFAAGLNYSFPSRTYFRDSFWTCLGLTDVMPKLVRDQILVLSRGVHEDGCPSGVMFLTEEERDFLREQKLKNPLVKENVRYEIDWWSDHHDSGFLFILLLSHYVQSTGDSSILGEIVDKDTLLSKALKILIHSEKFVVKGLFKKPFDCKDWSDNVFRNGFVTYDVALHIAAMREMSHILNIAGMRRESERWRENYLSSREKFNKTLFDEKKGYFVDFLGDYIEDHLSLDTVVAIIFDIAEESKALSSLMKMEKLLETKNNEKQPYGDWGVMNVWPGYKKKSHLFGKSAFHYRYHNGACWPYLSCVYAIAKNKYGLDPSYPLLSWWKYSLERGWVNLVEYYSPCYGRGSLNQSWSSLATVAIKQVFCV